MNKINIPGVLIVEGKEDVSYLSSFVNALFFTTNGYDLSKEKIEFLNRATEVNNLIVFTDSDEAGELIRKRLKEAIPDVKEARCDLIFRKNAKKRGVAETEFEAIQKALLPFIGSPLEIYDYNLNSLISLSKNPSESKRILIEKYRLIGGNNKSIEHQLNILRIKHCEIKELLSGN